jgi:hypothetical protein
MSISTYAELQTAVANWLHKDGLTSIIPDLIRIGELRIFREVRCRVMETAFSGTISNGSIAVPSDYLEFKFAYINDTPTSQLSRMSGAQLYSKWPTRTAQGKPQAIARQGTNFIFGPYPDSGYSVAGIYYAKPTSIQSSNNALFVANPDLYLFAALAEAAPYIGDDKRVPLWDAKYGSIKQQMAFEDSSESGGAGTMAVSTA